MSEPRADNLWQLTLHEPTGTGYETAENLGFLDAAEALSVSVFVDGNSLRIEAIFGSEQDAHTAQAQFGGKTEHLAPRDWVSETQAGLPPVIAGRFVVHGSHDMPAAGEDVIPILVDAGLAFGTGHHGTTKGCLLLLDQLSSRSVPQSILDLGTGAGVLAIGAAKLFPQAAIMATDNDPDAVDVTRENMALNGVSFKTCLADGFESPDLKGQTYDLILANILAGPLRELAEDIFKATAPGGTAILSGILDEQADWVSERFEAAGFALQAQPSLEGWTTLKAEKRN